MNIAELLKAAVADPVLLEIFSRPRPRPTLTGIVYAIRDVRTNKLYVGSTMQTLKKRWSVHCNFAKKLNTPIYQAMRLAARCFVIEPLEMYSGVPAKEKKEFAAFLRSREQLNIDRLKTNDPQFGYNVNRACRTAAQVQQHVAVRNQAYRKM